MPLPYNFTPGRSDAGAIYTATEDGYTTLPNQGGRHMGLLSPCAFDAVYQMWSVICMACRQNRVLRTMRREEEKRLQRRHVADGAESRLLIGVSQARRARVGDAHGSGNIFDRRGLSQYAEMSTGEWKLASDMALYGGGVRPCPRRAPYADLLPARSSFPLVASPIICAP
jgi:hypothetical protein